MAEEASRFRNESNRANRTLHERFRVRTEKGCTLDLNLITVLTRPRDNGIVSTFVKKPSLRYWGYEKINKKRQIHTISP